MYSAIVTSPGHRNERQDAAASTELGTAASRDVWVFLCRGLDQVVLECVRGSRGTARHIQFVEDIADMSGNRLLAQPEFVGDRAVRSSGRNQTKNLQLTGRETRTRTDRFPQGLQTRDV